MSHSSATPDMLNTKPKGVTKLNKLPILIVLALLLMVFVVVYYGGQDRVDINSNNGEDEMDTADLIGRQHLQGFGDGLLVPEPKAPPPIVGDTVIIDNTKPPPPPPAEMLAPPPVDPFAAQLLSMRREQWLQALGADSQVSDPQRGQAQATAGPSLSSGVRQGIGHPPASRGLSLSGQTGFLADQNFFAATSGTGEVADQGLQGRKTEFLGSGGDFGELGYLEASVRPALSPYTLNSGSVLPIVMLTGINSDLPGFITAQVSQNVYDSATGRFVLIPAGTRVMGVYDSQIAFAQKRLLVAWNKLVFPNGSTLQLGSMPGGDAIGQAGLADQVDNHYLQMFGAAILASLFSIGFELSQDQSDDGEDGAGDTARQVVGQQVALLGVQLARRGLNVQPTITIRPGVISHIMVTKDIVFPGTYTAQ